MKRLIRLLPHSVRRRARVYVDSLAPPDPTARWPERMRDAQVGHAAPLSNPLLSFFDSRTEGRGIWKWRHYFEIYHRHFAKFIGSEVNVLEIGVYSGGSLEMWKHYFGPRARVVGLDVEPACKCYEDDQVRIVVGNQGDRELLRRLRHELPTLDVVIDDGSHVPEQQIASFEELFPHLRPGGVYVCEDITGDRNLFGEYIGRFARHLHAYDCQANVSDLEHRLVAQATVFQRGVHSVHLYPFVAVVERAASDVTFLAPKHGTRWQPFLS